MTEMPPASWADGTSVTCRRWPPRCARCSIARSSGRKARLRSRLTRRYRGAVAVSEESAPVPTAVGCCAAICGFGARTRCALAVRGGRARSRPGVPCAVVEGRPTLAFALSVRAGELDGGFTGRPPSPISDRRGRSGGFVAAGAPARRRPDSRLRPRGGPVRRARVGCRRARSTAPGAAAVARGAGLADRGAARGRGQPPRHPALGRGRGGRPRDRRRCLRQGEPGAGRGARHGRAAPPAIALRWLGSGAAGDSGGVSVSGSRRRTRRRNRARRWRLPRSYAR